MAAATAVEEGDRLRCSFCAKLHTEVERLVAGPGVYICNECVGLCNEVMDQSRRDETSEPRLPEWKDLDDDAMLGHIANIAATAERIDETLKAWVSELRRRRVTWARIGDALGVTRQSAWERFSVATGEE
jgi:hypothetical protein